MKDTNEQRFSMLELMRQRYEEYGHLKANWVEDHPYATPEEYAESCRKIADQLGL